MEKKSVRKKNHTPSKEELRSEISATMTELGLWREELSEEIPTHWDVFKNFVIFNSKFFVNSLWNKAGPNVWERISKIFSGKSIALQGRIEDDDYRSPNTTILFGDSAWVEYLDNNIVYTWNCEYTMFCTGNISERHRIASLDCEGKTVVDMFAGIGYFTLPYLVHARAEHVIACEWNPKSVEALKVNLIKNKVTDRCTVHEGDVRQKCPRGIADHINMGLIPSCEQYWPIAVEILKPSGGWLHLHGNVTSFSKSQQFSVHCKDCLLLLESLSIDVENMTLAVCSTGFKITILDGKLKIDKLEYSCIVWKKVEWFVWSIHVSHSLCEYFCNFHKKKWVVMPKSLHRVKSYAPHIDHLVLDILCENDVQSL